jgi:ATP-dependent Lon protease
MFITTANLMDPIPSALRDRMEVIELSGYTEEEKLGIARNYLIPRQLEAHGISEKHAHLSDLTLRKIIFQYTREAGVRNLEREIANVLRKVARKVAEGKDKTFVITPKNLHKYLGVPKYLPEMEQDHNEVGVGTGLAWTESGGDIIYIEATIMKGKGSLTLTGHLGDVMKESAQAALSYIRSISKDLGIHQDLFSKNDVHVHVPAGAIPKDGPSAGITMATTLASIFTGIPVKREVAMTGEVTLRGRVLPVGGLKEKILAAKRAGLKTVILPSQNKKDLEDVPKNVRRELRFVFADSMETVLAEALDRPVTPKSKGETVPEKPIRQREKSYTPTVTAKSP